MRKGDIVNIQYSIECVVYTCSFNQEIDIRYCVQSHNNCVYSSSPIPQGTVIYISSAHTPTHTHPTPPHTLTPRAKLPLHLNIIVRSALESVQHGRYVTNVHLSLLLVSAL